MAGAAGGLDGEAGDGVAAGGDLVAGSAGFGDQHGGVPGGFGFDDVAGGGGADFLVAGEQHGDRASAGSMPARWSCRRASRTRRLPPFMS